MADLNDKWIWLSIGLGVAYGGFGTSLTLLGWWIFNPRRLTVPKLSSLTRTGRVTLGGAALMWMVIAPAYGLGGIYYCISYLQQRFEENAQKYTGGFLLGTAAMLPLLFWTISKCEARWRNSEKAPSD